jgi:hypothetical protein
MGGRSLAPFLLAAAVLVGACSEGANDVSTAPEFAPKPASCNFTTISSLVKTEFGASSTESGLATDMKNAGAQTALATSLGYQILASVGDKYDGSQTSTSNASALTVALLKCMSIGGTPVPSSTVFDQALGASGALGVVALQDADKHAVLSHDDGWLLKPPGTQSWQDVLPAGTPGPVLVYGVPLGADEFTNDVPKSGVFDWSTIPGPLTFGEIGDPGVVIGECQAQPRYLQHNSAATTPEVLGFVSPNCLTIIGLGKREPRTFAERVFRLLAPTPAYATLLTTTGSGGSKRTLSPFQVIDPVNVVLDPGFNWSKSGNKVSVPFSPTPNYQIRSDAETPFLQEKVLIWITAANNSGVDVKVCNNWAYTDKDGVASFPTSFLNKAGGYTVTTRSAGAVDNSQADITLPTVLAADPLLSPLFNVKNNSANPPTSCETFVPQFNADGFVTNPPEYPGPNGP